MTQGTNSAVPDDLPVKRKRGRPRKDRNQTQGYISTTPTPDTENKNQRRRIDSEPESVTDSKNEMVGQAVFGVLDGSFDAGYMLTVRVGDTDTILKGVVFQPGSSVPISGSNDVAPHVKMLRRADIHIPIPQVQHVQVTKRPDEGPVQAEGKMEKESESKDEHMCTIEPPMKVEAEAPLRSEGTGEVDDATAQPTQHVAHNGDKSIVECKTTIATAQPTVHSTQQ